MNQGMNSAATVPPENPKGRNTTLIIIIVVLVVCCLCALALGVLWQFGDSLLQLLGLGS
jgi:flagellar basal body-associated protein FliL